VELHLRFPDTLTWRGQRQFRLYLKERLSYNSRNLIICFCRWFGQSLDSTVTLAESLTPSGYVGPDIQVPGLNVDRAVSYTDLCFTRLYPVVVKFGIIL